MARFVELMKKTVEKWSNKISTGYRTFNSSVSLIELSEWTKGFQGAKEKLNVQSVDVENCTRFFVPSGRWEKITEEHIQNVTKMRWNTFKQFRNRAFSLYVVDMPREKENWNKEFALALNILNDLSVNTLLELQ